MPIYDYHCERCNTTVEVKHAMSQKKRPRCEACKSPMKKQFSTAQTFICKSGGVENWKDKEHTKKVKDKERAYRSRKKHFGSFEAPVESPNPMHIVKRGKVIAGQDKEIDRQEFIKAAAKDDYTVKVCENVLKKKK